MAVVPLLLLLLPVLLGGEGPFDVTPLPAAAGAETVTAAAVAAGIGAAVAAG